MRNRRETEANAFSPKLLAVCRRPPSPLPRAVLATLLMLLAGLLVWAIFGRLDIVARAQGHLVPAERVQIVQPFEGGRIAEILVGEGELVLPGQPLLRMDAALAEVETEALQRELTATRVELARIAAELEGSELAVAAGASTELRQRAAQRLVADREAYRDAVQEQREARARVNAELAGAQRAMARLEDALPILQEIESAHVRLAESGDVAPLVVLQRRRERLAAEQELDEHRREVDGLQGRAREITARLERLASQRRSRLLAQRTELETRARRLAADLDSREYRNGLRVLVAPQGGVVKNLATHTEGYVVPAGDPLLTLVPTGQPLQAEVRVSNRDIGFVEAGQSVRLKMAAYPFQRFGTLEARVARVSPDAEREQPSARAAVDGAGSAAYRAVLELASQRLERDDGESLLLRPGMAVVAEVRLGERSVMEYLLSPIRRTLDYAGKER